MVETRFVTPDAHLVDEVVSEALRAAGQPAARECWVRIEHGSANLVVLAGRVAVRVSRTPEAAVASARAQGLIDTLPELPFSVPRSLADPVRAGGLVAFAQQRIDGEAHSSGAGDPAQLRRLLAGIHEVPLEQVSQHLAPARTFMGGTQWFTIMTENAIPLLNPTVRHAARRAAEALVGLEPIEPALTHGDLASANVLWKQGRVSGVLDWDLASADDPAEDVAALATWHGWDTLAQASTAGEVQRARAFAATYPLQLVCFAIVNGRPQQELDRAVAKANAELLD